MTGPPGRQPRPEPTVIAFVDAHYRGDAGAAACVLAPAWTAQHPVERLVTRIDAVEPYVPGRFFERELPCALAVLGRVLTPLATIVVDGYVWLDAAGNPGLGAHLFDALGRQVAVVGVAKTPFRGSSWAEPVLRGRSIRPLYVTAAGMDAREAAAHVRAMHGEHRIPTLLREVDRLARDAVA